MQGMEGGLFRLCNDSTGFGQAVGLQAGVPQPTPWPEGGRSTYRGWTLDAYYVRWVLQNFGDPARSDSVNHISSGPRLVVTNILELRAPRPGECGWHEGELRDPAP
jgi:hypothetical protein